MPSHRLRIQQLTLIIRAPLHPAIIPKAHDKPRPRREINSADS
jgi:hypothetical protein